MRRIVIDAKTVHLPVDNIPANYGKNVAKSRFFWTNPPNRLGLFRKIQQFGPVYR